MKAKHCLFFSLLLISMKSFSQGAMGSLMVRDSNMVKQLFFAGLREKLNENYSVASNNFLKIVALDPKNHAAYYELANINLRLDKPNDAETNIKQAIILNGDNKWYWILISEIYKRKNDMPEFILALNQLIRIDSEQEVYYFDLANAQFISNQIEDSKKTYNLIEAKFGDSRELTQARHRFLSTKDSDQGDLVKLLESSKATAKNYLYAASLLLHKGNEKEAINILQRALVKEPENFEVNLSLADIYLKQGNYELSFSTLKLAFESTEMPLDDKIKIIVSIFSKLKDPQLSGHITEMSKLLAEKYPTEAKVLGLYGDVLYQQNKLKEALVQYLQALKQKGQIYAVWEQVINIQTLLGHYKEAVKVGEDALTIYPNQASLYYFMGYALFKTGQSDQALANLNSALQLDAENKVFQSQVYALNGDIYINKNNFPLAKVAFEKAIALDPDNYFVMNNYAYYLALRNDDLTKAENFARLASAAMPNSASIADTYAFVLFKLNKFLLAQQWIEKALKNNTTNSGVYFERYGDILFMQGKKELALQQWQKAKELGNGSEDLNKKINEKKYIK